MEILETPYFRGGRVEQSERTFFSIFGGGSTGYPGSKKRKET